MKWRGCRPYGRPHGEETGGRLLSRTGCGTPKAADRREPVLRLSSKALLRRSEPQILILRDAAREVCRGSASLCDGASACINGFGAKPPRVRRRGLSNGHDVIGPGRHRADLCINGRFPNLLCGSVRVSGRPPDQQLIADVGHREPGACRVRTDLDQNRPDLGRARLRPESACLVWAACRDANRGRGRLRFPCTAFPFSCKARRSVDRRCLLLRLEHARPSSELTPKEEPIALIPHVRGRFEIDFHKADIQTDARRTVCDDLSGRVGVQLFPFVVCNIRPHKEGEDHRAALAESDARSEQARTSHSEEPALSRKKELRSVDRAHREKYRFPCGVCVFSPGITPGLAVRGSARPSGLATRDRALRRSRPRPLFKRR